MKFQNGERATIRIEKLTEYALNPEHPVGKHKARLFDRLLGIGTHNLEPLLDALHEAAAEGEAIPGRIDAFGRRYTIDFPLQGLSGATVVVRSAWIVRGDAPPDLVTCFIL